MNHKFIVIDRKELPKKLTMFFRLEMGRGWAVRRHIHLVKMQQKAFKFNELFD